jgi:hypothetical protein
MARYQTFSYSGRHAVSAGSYLLGNALREWPIECLVASMTITPSRGSELNRVRILLEAFATEREAIAIEQSPDQIDKIQAASSDACLPSVTDLTSVLLIRNKQMVQ